MQVKAGRLEAKLARFLRLRGSIEMSKDKQTQEESPEAADEMNRLQAMTGT